MADQDPGGISPLQQMMASGAGAVVTSLFSKTWGDVVGAAGDWVRPEIGSDLVLEEGYGGFLKGGFRLSFFPSDSPGRGKGPLAVSAPLSDQW